MIKRVIGSLVVLVWSLWFGGAMALFAFVSNLFKADRGIAIQAAPVLFHTFESLQLGVAAVALVGVFVWYLVERGRGKIVIFLLLGLAAVAAVVSTMAITPRIDELRLSGLSSTSEFGKWHGIAMAIYSGQAILLLIGGILALTSLSAPSQTPA